MPLTKDRSRYVFVLVVLAMLFGVANVSPAAALGTLDQEQASPSPSFTGAALNQTLKQTFTADMSGFLTDVSVYGHLQNTPPPGDLILRVTDADGTDLASASVPGASFLDDPFKDRWITVSFASPPPVTAGTQYTLVVTSSEAFSRGSFTSTGIYYINVATSDPYSGGSVSHWNQAGSLMSESPSFDIAFRTYVSSSRPTDKTAPTLHPLVSPNPVLLNGVATVTSGAADEISGSGLASASCGALDTSTVGAKSVTCTATDNAGNSNSATVTYNVIYNWSGFVQPVESLRTLNVAKAGRAIPVKFSLAGNQGLGIMAAGYPRSNTTTCGSTGDADDETAVTAGSSSLSYDATTDRYNYVWNTNRAWAGTCRTLTMKLIDGTIHQADFKFTK